MAESASTNRTFATTRWDLVRAAAADGTLASRALASICEAYWKPVHSHILWRLGNPDLAEDLTQDFFAKFLSHGWFLRPDPERGKFRTFLLVVLQRFLNDEAKRSRTWKRGGRTIILPLHEAPEPVAADITESFDRAWARHLLHRAFVALRGESDHRRFEALSPFLQREPAPGEYPELGALLDCSPNSVAAAVRRMRRRLRELLKEEVRQTLGSREDPDEETAYLLHLLLG